MIAALCHRSADILVAAIGMPEFVKGDWIKEGAVSLFFRLYVSQSVSLFGSED